MKPPSFTFVIVGLLFALQGLAWAETSCSPPLRCPVTAAPEVSGDIVRQIPRSAALEPGAEIIVINPLGNWGWHAAFLLVTLCLLLNAVVPGVSKYN